MITIKTGGTNTVMLGFLHLVILFLKKKTLVEIRSCSRRCAPDSPGS